MERRKATTGVVETWETDRQGRVTRAGAATGACRPVDRSSRSSRQKTGLRAALGRAFRPGPVLVSPVLGLLVLLAGCGADPKAANKDNFTRAIQAFEQANPERMKICTRIYTGMSEPSTEYLPSIRDTKSFPETEGLAKLGYLTITDTTAQGIFGPEKAVSIAVTPKFIQAFGNPTSYSQDACVGTFHLEHVDDFTAPAEMMGYQVSQVEATVRQTVTAEWTRDARLTKLVQYTAPTAERKQRYMLLLKDSGWAVDSLR